MITLKINGQQKNWDGDPDLPLLWFLRDEVGLTGTKYGCGQALCGACTVIVDKQAMRACITSVSDVVGREVTTIEGLHPTGDHAVQKAWRQLNVPQCGFCQVGQIMQAAALLIRKSETDARSDTRGDGGQYLPLRLLPAHRKRGPPRVDGGMIMNILTNPKKLRGFERYVKVDNVSRRSILKGLGLAGGFVLAAPVMSRPALAAYQTGADEMPHGTVVDPRVFVAIAPDGIVTIVAHRAEMGTGVRTSLPMIVAEEMEADWSRVRVQQAHGDEVKFGNQDTDGSRSTRHYLMPMRQIGASARTMLEAAAAKRWGVPATEVKAVNHEVVHSASGRRIGFGDLAADAAKELVPSVEGLKLKDPKDFRYLGKGQISMVDLRDITVGTARYGADVRLPGMKYAVIARPPVTGGKVASFDGAAAMKVSGVEKVMEVKGWPWPSKFQPLGGVAVIARNTGAAIKGRDALKIVWDDGANGKYDSVAYRAELEEAARKPGLVVRKEGDVEAALKGADKVIVGEYYLPHLAHVAMEPPVAVADVKGDKAEIWAPVQSAGGTREDVAKTLGIPEENVTVNVTLLGGGFGRKSKCDYAIEAALLSKELGAPVKVQWTREDDVRNGFLHTVSVERIEAGLDKSGKVTAWRHRSVAPSIASTFAAECGASGAVRTRHGACRHALRDRQRPVRESGSGRAYPHRLVPLGVEHPARLCGAVDGRRDRPGDQTRSKGHAAGADRLAADRQARLR